jgi:hypothetical protein
MEGGRHHSDKHYSDNGRMVQLGLELIRRVIGYVSLSLGKCTKI